LVKVGVAVIVAVMGEVPVFTAVKAGRLPEPEAGSPMSTASLDHEYVVVPPVLTVVNAGGVVKLPLQTTRLAG
jgi:hypothetical protein